MNSIWNKRYGTDIPEPRLCDQVKMIRKKEGMAKLELDSIRRKVLQNEKDIEVNNNDNTGEQCYQDEENIHENEAKEIRAIGENKD